MTERQWISVQWDASRACYRARIRTATSDVKRKVPENILAEAGIDSSRPTKRGQSAAEAWAHQQLTAELQRAEPDLEYLTIGEIFRLFQRRNPGDVEASTIDKYRLSAETLGKFFGTRRPDSIDHAAASDFVAWCRETRELAPRTIKNHLAFLKHVLQWGLEWQRETGMDGIRLVRMPKVKVEETRGRALTFEEVGKLMAVPLGQRDLRDYDLERAQLAIAIGTTLLLRRTPLLQMRLEWIDFEKAWLEVPGAIQKTRKPLSIPIPRWTLERIKAFVGRRRTGPVLPALIDRDKGTKRLDGTMQNLAELAGVKRFMMHDLRRTGYTWLGELGVERIVRKVLMGHDAGIDVSDLYDQDFRVRLQSAADKLDAELREHLPGTAPERKRRKR